MSATLDDLLQQPPFGIRQAEKQKRLLPLLKDLTQHHRRFCEPYRRIVDLAFPNAEEASSLGDVPYLPISLFKFRRLRSINAADIRMSITSSGTTGSQKSQVDLDVETVKLSSRALNLIISSVTQNRRLPMLIIDSPASVQGKSRIAARAAAILGLMPFGRDHVFALHDDMSINEEAMSGFLAKYANQDVLIYGFTFLIWQHFVTACERNNYNLSQGILLHSGGWKRLTSIAVDNAAFKLRLKKAAKIDQVINFYGMAELPGTIFLEAGDGLLYPPHFADIIIRDPITLQPQPIGRPGLIQILSLIPRSYPGHSLITEDMGVIESVDSGHGGYYGHGFRILGRAPRAELRGCSDVLGTAELHD